MVDRDHAAFFNAGPARSALAFGRQDIVVPGVNRRDEVGVIARALDVLRKAQDTARRLSEEREQVQARRLERAMQLVGSGIPTGAWWR